jgi:hypothetical protein
MSDLFYDREEITPPSSFHGAPLTPPPTDEKQARDTSHILQHFTKARSGKAGQTTFQTTGRVWNAVEQLLLRNDKLRYTTLVSESR